MLREFSRHRQAVGNVHLGNDETEVHNCNFESVLGLCLVSQKERKNECSGTGTYNSCRTLAKSNLGSDLAEESQSSFAQGQSNRTIHCDKVENPGERILW